MGQGSSIPKCSGCDKTTPFFGEMYGRMSEKQHGKRTSGMGHGVARPLDDNSRNQYTEFNAYKNKLLIPFYGTVLAIRTIVAGLQEDGEKWEALGLNMNLAFELRDNTQLKVWFAARVLIALVPVVGTVVNGALDAIAQVGMQFKDNGAFQFRHSARELL